MQDRLVGKKLKEHAAFLNIHNMIVSELKVTRILGTKREGGLSWEGNQKHVLSTKINKNTKNQNFQLRK